MKNQLFLTFKQKNKLKLDRHSIICLNNYLFFNQAKAY